MLVFEGVAYNESDSHQGAQCNMQLMVTVSVVALLELREVVDALKWIQFNRLATEVLEF